MTNEKSVVIEAVQEMDSVVGNIGLHTEILHDVTTKFKTVIEDMNNAVYRGDQQAYYREHHHELRLLAELLYYCMQDVSKNHDDISALRNTLFQEVVKPSIGAQN